MGKEGIKSMHETISRQNEVKHKARLYSVSLMIYPGFMVWTVADIYIYKTPQLHGALNLTVLFSVRFNSC